MKLWQYIQKNVKVVFKNGKVMVGFVTDYFDKDDSESEYDSIAFETDTRFIEIVEDEIETIEIIE